LRNQVQALGPAGRERARQWLRSFHFTPGDLPSLHADREGAIAYACRFTLAPAPAIEGEDTIAAAACP
jgi:hypothetical protein